MYCISELRLIERARASRAIHGCVVSSYNILPRPMQRRREAASWADTRRPERDLLHPWYVGFARGGMRAWRGSVGLAKRLEKTRAVGRAGWSPALGCPFHPSIRMLGAMRLSTVARRSTRFRLLAAVPLSHSLAPIHAVWKSAPETFTSCAWALAPTQTPQGTAELAGTEMLPAVLYVFISFMPGSASAGGVLVIDVCVNSRSSAPFCRLSSMARRPMPSMSKPDTRNPEHFTSCAGDALVPEMVPCVTKLAGSISQLGPCPWQAEMARTAMVNLAGASALGDLVHTAYMRRTQDVDSLLSSLHFALLSFSECFVAQFFEVTASRRELCALGRRTFRRWSSLGGRARHGRHVWYQTDGTTRTSGESHWPPFPFDLSSTSTARSRSMAAQHKLTAAVKLEGQQLSVASTTCAFFCSIKSSRFAV